MSRRIGTLAEKSLHAALKEWYAQPGDSLECSLEGYVIDILHPSGDAAAPIQCIEIQTRSLGSMKPKLHALLDRYAVRIVHPIAQERVIVRIDGEGVIISRRKSPKRGSIYDLFPELVSFPALVTHPNLTLEVALVREEQVWMNDGKGSWRRKRWSIRDRRLIEVVGAHALTSPADFAALLPPDLPDVFDTQDIAIALRLSRPLAQKMAYCLREMSILQIVDRRGKAYLYRRVG